jgi:hypothetical protein
MSRAVVRVRVSSLEDIPWIFVFTEGTQFESNNWCVQCEIFQAAMLGNAPQDEDFPPNDGDFNPNNFQFQGFGQPINILPPPALAVHQFVPNQGLLNQLGLQAWPQDGEAAHIPFENIPKLIPLQEEEIENNEFEPQEEVLQAQILVEPPLIPDQLEHVLVMDDLIDSSNEMPPLIDNTENEVDMPPFPNLQNMAPLVVEDVQIELVPFENLAPNLNQNPAFGLADLNLGMVHTYYLFIEYPLKTTCID